MSGVTFSRDTRFKKTRGRINMIGPGTYLKDDFTNKQEFKDKSFKFDLSGRSSSPTNNNPGPGTYDHVSDINQNKGLSIHDDLDKIYYKMNQEHPLKPKNKHSELFKNTTSSVNLKMHLLTVQSKDGLIINKSSPVKDYKKVPGHPNSNHSSKSDFDEAEIEKINKINKNQLNLPDVQSNKKKINEISQSSKIQFGQTDSIKNKRKSVSPLPNSQTYRMSTMPQISQKYQSNTPILSSKYKFNFRHDKSNNVKSTKNQDNTYQTDFQSKFQNLSVSNIDEDNLNEITGKNTVNDINKKSRRFSTYTNINNVPLWSIINRVDNKQLKEKQSNETKLKQLIGEYYKHINNSTLINKPNIVISSDNLSRNLDRIKKQLNNETIELDQSPSPNTYHSDISPTNREAMQKHNIDEVYEKIFQKLKKEKREAKNLEEGIENIPPKIEKRRKKNQNLDATIKLETNSLLKIPYQLSKMIVHKFDFKLLSSNQPLNEIQEYIDPKTDEEKKCMIKFNSINLFQVHYNQYQDQKGIFYLNKPNNEYQLFTDHFNEEKPFKIRLHLLQILNPSSIRMGFKNQQYNICNDFSFDLSGKLQNVNCKFNHDFNLKARSKLKFEQNPVGYTVNVKIDGYDVLSYEMPHKRCVFQIMMSDMDHIMRVRYCEFHCKDEGSLINNKACYYQHNSVNVFKQ